MNDNLRRLIQKYRKKGLLIDTNLLLLYIVGSFDIELIREFKRTSQFTIDDFDFVSDFISEFELKITTPHILAEVDNFIGNKLNLRTLLKNYVSIVAREITTDSVTIVENEFFVEFGFTDTAIVNISNNSYLVLTDDNLFMRF